MNLKCAAALLGTVLFAASGPSASASSLVLSDPVWSAFVLTSTGQNQSIPKSFNTPLHNYTTSAADGWGGTGVSLVSTSTTPALTVSSTVTNLGTNPFSGRATAPYMETRATLTYSIAVVGPSGAPIALTVSGNGAAITPNNFNASASVYLDLDFSGGHAAIVGANVISNTVQHDGTEFTQYMSGPISGFTYARTVTVPVNSIINVSMSVLADDSGAPLLASSYAYLDPFFSVSDERYSILTSPGILNEMTSAVPEPSTWAMLLLGFAGIGLVSRRRRKPTTLDLVG